MFYIVRIKSTRINNKFCYTQLIGQVFIPTSFTLLSKTSSFSINFISSLGSCATENNTLLIKEIAHKTYIS